MRVSGAGTWTDGSCGQRGLLLPQPPLAKIAKALVGLALLRITGQHGPQFVLDLRVLDDVFPNAVEPRARGVAAEPELVATGGFAHERDFRHIRSRAAVRTTGRADDDFLTGQSDFFAQQFDAVHQTRQ